MYIRVSERRIVNAANVTDVEDLPAADESEERAVVVHMVGGRTIALSAAEAEHFMAALPGYEPGLEGPEQSAAWMDGYRDGQYREPYDAGYPDLDQATEKDKAEYLRAYEAGAREGRRK